MSSDLALSRLCSEVCEEFQSLGTKKDVDPRTFKESFNIVKRPSGQWFKVTKAGLHGQAVETQIDFQLMPKLKKLTELLDSIDSEINKKGGRIFITENLITKMKKGSEHPVLIEENKNKKGAYRNLCNELKNAGLENDRYRTEETYMLTRSSGGEWSMMTSHENHSGEKIVLALSEFPLLKNIAVKIGKADPQFQSNGGRVFITPERIYRLKNKIEINFKF